MTIDQIMTRTVATCSPHETMDRAAQLLWDNDCGCVPVIDERRRVVGMLTDRDICMAAYTQGRPLSAMQVSSAMSTEVFACSPSDGPMAAEKLMRARQVRRLPVVDGQGLLIGIVSLSDLAREAAKEQSAKRRQVTDAEVGETLAAVCRARSAVRQQSLLAATAAA